MKKLPAWMSSPQLGSGKQLMTLMVRHLGSIFWPLVRWTTLPSFTQRRSVFVAANGPLITPVPTRAPSLIILRSSA